MFRKTIQLRIKIVLYLFCLLLLIIILRVLYIQVFKQKELLSLSNELWTRNLPLGASRGLILDRNGKELAVNETTVSLAVVPSQIKDKEKVARDIASILNTDYLNIYAHLTKVSAIERIHPEGRKLSYEIADRIKELNYDGVYLLREYKRYYPYGDVLSHVLGYVGIDNQGLSGVELEYDDILTGADGALKYYSNAKGLKLNINEEYNEPISGSNVELTIDIDIQLAVERELDNSIIKYNPDHALAIVMDPNTGEIIAMSSRPNFDGNDYQKYDLESINRNLPIWMNYEPGSTFKNVATI